MFLKRLELYGFKSFADKTELEFVQGITAVVGPNGSGKSNISDSIRWVLGEQSARSLRGGKMEDIIFAGSDARKAVNFGEVSLTLDNSDQALSLDFTEVTVTRRVHRNGDSEYLINKQPCRLKDITELFMDTGIGKEAYSIIGQGRIEEILSTRSEERRGIFEEAAGIVKYKARKKEAEKKLNETEQNLLRIHDLVSELEDQVEPLREQSEKANAFKVLKEQLKSSEISMYVHQIDQLHRSWSEANDKLAALQMEQLELSTIVNQHDAQLEKHRFETRRLEDEIEQLQELLLKLSEDFEKCEGQGEVLKERQRHLFANRTQLAQMKATQQKRVEDKTVELHTYRENLQRIHQELADLHQRVAAEEMRLLGVNGETSSAAEQLLKAELLDKLNESAQSRNEIKFAEQHMESISKRMDRLEEERSKWAEQVEKNKSRKEDIHSRVVQVAQVLESARNEYIRLGEEMKSKQGLYSEAQLTVRKWEQKLDALISRRDTMKEMQNDYDGFAQGVKEVLKAKDRKDGLQGIHGAIAELVKVPSEVEIAMETALGGALQNIVMDNESAGREAIQFLKKRQLGRATFLPLDVIKSRSISDQEYKTIEALPGFVGIGAKLVRYDHKYNNIFGNLLGQVIIAKTLEEANRIAAKLQYRYRVVTLEGDVVNAGGSMTGGSQNKRGANLLSRNRVMDELDNEIRVGQDQLQLLREKAEQVKADIAATETKIEQLRAEGEQKRLEEQQLTAELNQLDNESRNAEEQLTLFLQDKDALLAEIRDHDKRKADSEKKLQSLKQEEERIQEAIREAEDARKASEAAKDELQEQLTELKVKAAAVAQEKQSIQDQVRRFEAELQELQLELQTNEQAYAQLEEELAANQQQSVNQIEELNALRLNKQNCSEQVEFKRAERADWIKQLEQEENHTREQRIQLKKVEESLHQTEVRANRMDVELDNLLKKLAEDYELSYELAKEKYPVPEDVIGTQGIVRDLKRQISLLGDVNLGAIEEYQRVNERYQFLSAQKNDLIEAKTTLYQVIRDMDEEMSKRFRAAFDEIRSHFVVVFAKLFGGGRADLILSEPHNLLDTGIEIVAQPPGKKLQNLQLLSGGERALTALALLFAILNVKPVPFCVLDEVEAALDEANVARYAAYLREFSGQTQFIVVTHRKGTMEEADVLYGVTMEEGGVSKLVSVRLEDEDAISA